VPEAGRDAKGQHVANLLALQPGEEIAQILDIRDYKVATHLVLATRDGKIKKTFLSEYDTNRQGGIIAIRLRGQEDEDGDEVVSALLVDDTDDILLISRHGMSLRFTATDESLRPMGRATEGVKGMSSARAIRCSRHPSRGRRVRVRRDRRRVRQAHQGDEYRLQGRGGLGIKVAKLNEDRGDLAGGLIVGEDDEVLVVLASGKVVRSAVAEVPAKGRDTMGVVFARPDDDDRILAIARNSERASGEDGRDHRPRPPLAPRRSDTDA
jgi:DNA gyrase subunit A